MSVEHSDVEATLHQSPCCCNASDASANDSHALPSCFATAISNGATQATSELRKPFTGATEHVELRLPG
jgi:hypothetical protein